MNWYLEGWRNGLMFQGRACRSEFWWFGLGNIVAMFVLAVLAVAVLGTFGVVLLGLYWLASLLPSLAVTVRRLHDTGRSGWMILISVIPLLGGLVLLVFELEDSHPHANQYGPSPKDVGVNPLDPEARAMLAVTPISATAHDQVVLRDGEGGIFGFRLLGFHEDLEPTAGPPAARGSRYVGVEIEIENMLGEEDAFASITPILFHDGGQAVQVALADRSPAFDLEPDLAPGARSHGFLLFEVPLSVRPVHLRLGLDHTRAVAEWPLDVAGLQ